MKASVDGDICVGCEACPTLCPDVFEMKGSVAVAKDGSVPDLALEACQETADCCPVDAITIEE